MFCKWQMKIEPKPTTRPAPAQVKINQFINMP
jgi:hypothetical protein